MVLWPCNPGYVVTRPPPQRADRLTAMGGCLVCPRSSARASEELTNERCSQDASGCAAYVLIAVRSLTKPRSFASCTSRPTTALSSVPSVRVSSFSTAAASRVETRRELSNNAATRQSPATTYLAFTLCFVTASNLVSRPKNLPARI